MITPNLIALVSCMLLAGASRVGATVRYVDENATVSVNDGTSWCDAYLTLQDALAVAVASDEIRVADGTYYPDQGGVETPGDRTATFQLINGVEIYGGYAGCEAPDPDARDIVANETILSGDLSSNDTTVACATDSPDCDSNGDLCVDGSCIIDDNNAENSFHVTTGIVANATAVLDGFTITAGNANGGFPHFRGAGMYNDSGGPTVTNCSFVGNSASVDGGGMYNLNASNSTVTNCSFRGNWAFNGAGMDNFTSSPTVTNCTFNKNFAANIAGGMRNSAGSPKVIDCVFSGNSANTAGGMQNDGASIVEVTNCTFDGNSANIGGAMYNASGNIAVTNCAFSGNSANFNGGGIFNTNAGLTITACTFSGNAADTLGGGVYTDNTVTMANCIFWGNIDDADGNGGGPFMDESAQIHTGGGTPTVDYSVVQGTWTGAGGTGNSSSDPLLIDADGPDNIAGTDDDNLRISFGSPAIDAGDNDALPADTADLDGDLNTTEEIPIDLAGNDRRIDDPNVVDTGNPGVVGAPVVDMGAFEFDSPIFVDASATGANDGTSWTDAYTSLQDALADPGVTGGAISSIWVADGTYMPDGGRTPVGGAHVSGSGANSATFQLVDEVAIYGGFAGGETSLEQRDIQANETILSGDLSGNDTPVGCTLDSQCASNGGHCAGDGFCVIFNGKSDNSIHIVTGSGTDSSAVLDGFTISRANANALCCGGNDRGGGMTNVTGSPTVSNCIFENSWASILGGAMYNGAGSSPTVTRCTFRRNATGGSGAGISNQGASNGEFRNCRILDNKVSLSGGGVVNENSNPSFINCTFQGNVEGGGGGAGMYNWDESAPQVVNCTFSGNRAFGGTGGMFNASGSPTVTNCIFWGNSDASGMNEGAQIGMSAGTPVVNYSIVQNLVPGGPLDSGASTTNIDGDPLFVDADGPDDIPGNEDDDLSLSEGSPAVDAGDNDALPADTSDLDNDGDTTEALPIDLAGAPRRLNDPLTEPDPGNPGALGAPVVDMGALEFVSGVLFVDDSAVGGDNGSSWADARTSLQDALDVAATVNADADPFNDITKIWVADGTYEPDQGVSETPGDRTATFQLQNGVGIFGGFAGGETGLEQRDIEGNKTILIGDLLGDDSPVSCVFDLPDCDSNGGLCVGGFCIISDNNGENSYHVTTGSGTDATAVLDGFTITAGAADGASFESFGGGMFNDAGSPTVTNSTFSGNSATGRGGAMFNDAGNPTVTNCTFIGNSVDGFAAVGGAVINTESSATFIDCKFISNSSNGSGGGGMFNLNSGPLLINCMFSGNSVTTTGTNGGGAMENSGGSSPILVNCVMANNTTSGGFGGGGAIYNSFGSPLLTNCVLWGNTDGNGNDELDQMFTLNGTPVVNHTLVQGLTGVLGGVGNIGGDPLFVDADGADDIPGTQDDDLRISVGSPAVDAGDNDALPADTGDLDGDMDTSEEIPIDLAGNDRRIDDPNVVDTGNAGDVGAPVVDMGAYELDPPIFVDVNAPQPRRGFNDGSSWTDAYTDLQDALTEAAGTPRDIWVAAGTYTPDAGMGHTPGLRSETFQLINGVAIFGGFAGGETSLDQRDIESNETILSGDLLGDDTPVACVVDSPDCDSNGGLCVGGFCIIKQDNGENSLHVTTASGTDATAVLDGFHIRSGFADGSDPDNTGAGMLNFAGSPTVVGCTFTGNRATFFGGAVNNNAAAPIFLNCRFIGNAAFTGGAMVNANATVGMVISNCSFESNKNDALVFDLSPGAGTITNSVFSGNSTENDGAAILFERGSSATITNCTFTNNTATNVGGGIGFIIGGGSPTFTNCIFWSNSPTEFFKADPGDGNPSVGFSIVQGPLPVGILDAGGNIDADPLFVDADGADDIVGTEDDNLRLLPCSPGIDSGDNTVVTAPTDLDGNPRLVDDPGTLDTGNGAPPVVDMGAFEFQLANDDCNQNGVPDLCDIANMTSNDCNGNDVPDECEIDENSVAPGGPFFCTAGCDPDCTDNGIPDECDIANCPFNFVNPEDCDDCNLNGVPDRCDIVAMTSQDADMNGVPDECTNFDGGGEDQNWDTPDNWEDDAVPGKGDNVTIDANDPASRRAAFLGQTTVILNIQVNIDSLRLLNGATLNVATDDSNLTIDTSGGILITAEQGSSRSRLRVGNDRIIEVLGSFTIDSGGLYEALVKDGETPVATLDVAKVEIISRCPDDFGGEMSLSGEMEVRTSGDFVIDASRDCLPCSSGGRAGGLRSPRGGKTRPTLRSLDSAIVSIGGDFLLLEGATIDYGSSEPLVVQGSFLNQSTCPDFFNWTTGGISFDVAGSRSFPQGPGGQSFEVAGRDLGPSDAGFANNFAVGEVKVASGRSVAFVDRFDNDRQGQTAQEALYVATLRVGVGATVEVDNCSVYYQQIIPPEAESDVVLTGTARFEQVSISSPVRAPPPHDILKNRYISIDPRGASGNNPASHHIRLIVDSSQVSGQVGAGPWWATAPVNGAGLSPAVCISVVTTTKPATEPDWSACPTVHLTGCPIVPTTTYAIAAESGGSLSAEILLDTQAKPGVKWHGDCVGFFDGKKWTPPNGTTSIDDAVAGIKTFQDPSAINATHLSVSDVHPNLNGTEPNLIVSIADVFVIILGFQGQEYPGPDLTQCP